MSERPDQRKLDEERAMDKFMREGEMISDIAHSGTFQKRAYTNKGKEVWVNYKSKNIDTNIKVCECLSPLWAIIVTKALKQKQEEFERTATAEGLEGV